ncbi:MAG: Aspartate-semialdehyde dehydrogenase 2 [Chlamydiae bacterium]|nr:Aspartate-semialdehyde dehydrogenase 2 [Chlamydiota bacterium]
MVGQKFIELLLDHPWFEIAALAASERSVGKPYKEATIWRMKTPIPKEIAEMPVVGCDVKLPSRVAFSGLTSQAAKIVEKDLLDRGVVVISNAGSYRMDPAVPLLIPEINSDHLQLVDGKTGMIVTNPNCSVIGIAMALKPLIDHWGIDDVQVVTLQALSGAGYPGVASLDIIDNVIPFISNEEDKVETEPQKIFGEYKNGKIDPYPMRISAQCTRVPVADGHTACISVKLKKKARHEEIIEAWESFRGRPQELDLPLAPKQPIHYFSEPSYPQPKLHRNLEGGMAVSIGRLRPCPLNDWKFVLLSHNTVRGAAGGAILNAELMVKEGRI